jgi:hypothetical protein
MTRIIISGPGAGKHHIFSAGCYRLDPNGKIDYIIARTASNMHYEFHNMNIVTIHDPGNLLVRMRDDIPDIYYWLEMTGQACVFPPPGE